MLPFNAQFLYTGIPNSFDFLDFRLLPLYPPNQWQIWYDSLNTPPNDCTLSAAFLPSPDPYNLINSLIAK